METEFIQIRNNQRGSWNTFSPGWKKWDDFTMRFLQEQGNQIIHELNLNPSDKVLDIASGTGEPGLTIAANILQNGHVTAIDLSEHMLSIAQEKAETLSIKNFSVLAADACDLPFEDASFDAISCRLGFMFFPDMKMAAKEMLRVLKPGGRLVATVWAEPTRNLWITTIMKVLNKHLELPAANPNAPGLFRCASPGLLTTLFNEVGTGDGYETDINGVMSCSTSSEYWDFMNDVVPPVVSALRSTSDDLRDSIRKEVSEIFEENIAQGNPMPYAARLFSATKS
ncbi:MAG: class I SAM-dependent methyltransferase [Bacteroidota bacterium]